MQTSRAEVKIDLDELKGDIQEVVNGFALVCNDIPYFGSEFPALLASSDTDLVSFNLEELIAHNNELTRFASHEFIGQKDLNDIKDLLRIINDTVSQLLSKYDKMESKQQGEINSAIKFKYPKMANFTEYAKSILHSMKDLRTDIIPRAEFILNFNPILALVTKIDHTKSKVDKTKLLNGLNAVLDELTKPFFDKGSQIIKIIDLVKNLKEFIYDVESPTSTVIAHTDIDKEAVKSKNLIYIKEIKGLIKNCNEIIEQFSDVIKNEIEQRERVRQSKVKAEMGIKDKDQVTAVDPKASHVKRKNEAADTGIAPPDRKQVAEVRLFAESPLLSLISKEFLDLWAKTESTYKVVNTAFALFKGDDDFKTIKKIVKHVNSDNSNSEIIRLILSEIKEAKEVGKKSKFDTANARLDKHVKSLAKANPDKRDYEIRNMALRELKPRDQLYIQLHDTLQQYQAVLSKTKDIGALKIALDAAFKTTLESIRQNAAVKYEGKDEKKAASESPKKSSGAGKR